MTRKTGIVLASVACLAWVKLLALDSPDLRLVLLVMVGGAACLYTALARALPTRWLALSLVAMTASALCLSLLALGHASASSFLSLPVFLAAALLHPGWAVPVLCLVSWVLLQSGPALGEQAWVHHLALVTIAALATVVTWDLRTALFQTWREVEHAGSLMRELRVRQEEINRLNKALRDSNSLLRRSLAELALLEKEALEARHLKEQFATAVSHELRTPLNIILGFLDVMQRHPEAYGPMNWTLALQQDLAEIQRSASHLSALVDDILDLARIQALKMPLHRQNTDLSALLTETTTMASKLLSKKPSVSMTVEVAEDLPPVYLDPVRIRQVLINLLANACRFTDTGRIVVRATAVGGEIVVSVADTGTGIPPGQLESIFNEFRQADSGMTQDQAVAGKGLGLAIAKRFVQMHGGRIWAVSSPGQGSTFYFAIPHEHKQVVSLPPPPVQQTTTTEGAPTLVLVGDEEAKRFLARHLESDRIVTATDLGEARQMLHQLHPQALLVDVPPQGEEAVYTPPAEILPEPVPVIHCSLPSARWYVDKDLFDDWLVKPVRVDSLLKALARCSLGPRVLIVDDDRAFVRLVRRILEAEISDCQVFWAHDAEDALAILRRRQVDVVLLDLALPGADGRSLARTIRREWPDRTIAMIAVTALQPGQESSAFTPRHFTITSSVGIGEEQTLALIRSCLTHLKPAFPCELPASGPQVEPAEAQAS